MLPRHAFKVLGLPDTASQETVKAAWRKKARLLHPDSPYGNLDAFLTAKAAYETLCPAPKQIMKQRVRVAAKGRRHR